MPASIPRVWPSLEHQGEEGGVPKWGCVPGCLRSSVPGAGGTGPECAPVPGAMSKNPGCALPESGAHPPLLQTRQSTGMHPRYVPTACIPALHPLPASGICGILVAGVVTVLNSAMGARHRKSRRRSELCVPRHPRGNGGLLCFDLNPERQEEFEKFRLFGLRQSLECGPLRLLPTLQSLDYR